MFTPSPSVRTATPNTHEGAGGGTLSGSRARARRCSTGRVAWPRRRASARSACAPPPRAQPYFIAAFDNPFSPLEVSFQVLSEFACRTAKQIELGPARRARTEEGHGIWSVPHTHATRVWLRSMHPGRAAAGPRSATARFSIARNYEGRRALRRTWRTAARVSKPPLAIDRLQGLSDRVRVVCEVADALLCSGRAPERGARGRVRGLMRATPLERTLGAVRRARGSASRSPEPPPQRDDARRALPPGSNAVDPAWAICTCFAYWAQSVSTTATLTRGPPKRASGGMQPPSAS